MATYYVWSGATGSNNGTSWTNAYVAFGSAVTAATLSGDYIKVHKTHTENLTVATTYTFVNHVIVLVVDKDNSDALATMFASSGYIGHTTTNYAITIAGAYRLYIHGLCLRTAGSTAASLQLIFTSGQQVTYNACYFWSGNTATTAAIYLGTANEQSGMVTCYECVFRFGSTSQSISIGDAAVEIYGGSISSSGSQPTTVFTTQEQIPPCIVSGMDFSSMGTGKTLVGDCSQGAADFVFSNCALASGMTIMATQTVTNLSSAEVFIYNCSSSAKFYNLAHYNALGSTETITEDDDNAIYLTTGGATYPYAPHENKRLSWKITTSSIVSKVLPYDSPRITKAFQSAIDYANFYLGMEIVNIGSDSSLYDVDCTLELIEDMLSNCFFGTPYVNELAQIIDNGAATTMPQGSGVSAWTGITGSAWSGLPRKLCYGGIYRYAFTASLRISKPSATLYVNPELNWYMP